MASVRQPMRAESQDSGAPSVGGVFDKIRSWRVKARPFMMRCAGKDWANGSRVSRAGERC